MFVMFLSHFSAWWRQIRLLMLPLRTGKFVIRGTRWQIGGNVNSEHRFALRVRRKYGLWCRGTALHAQHPVSCCACRAFL